MSEYRVRVKTGQRKEMLEVSGDIVHISVKEKPQEGAANARIIALMALHFKVPQGRIRILAGHHAPSKRVSVSR